MDDLSVIQRLGMGGFIEEFVEALTLTAAEVVETGKKGTVTVTMTLTTKGQGNPLVAFDEQIQRKSPKRDAQGAVFYAVEGGLHRDDPRQVRMEFHTVDGAGVLRETNVATGEVKETPVASVQREVS